VHLFQYFSGVIFCSEIRLDRLVHHDDECDDIAERYVRRGLDAIDLVLFQGRVAECDFVLIIEPILIVRAQAGVENPLLKPQAALLGILGDWGTIGRAGMAGEVGYFANDVGSPVGDELPGLIAEHFAGDGATSAEPYV